MHDILKLASYSSYELLVITQQMTLFQTLFNVVVIWMAIFIGLSKGLKSYGKVSLIFGVVPIVGLVVFCTKVLLPPIHSSF